MICFVTVIKSKWISGSKGNREDILPTYISVNSISCEVWSCNHHSIPGIFTVDNTVHYLCHQVHTITPIKYWKPIMCLPDLSLLQAKWALLPLPFFICPDAFWAPSARDRAHCLGELVSCPPSSGGRDFPHPHVPSPDLDLTFISQNQRNSTGSIHYSSVPHHSWLLATFATVKF